MQHRHRKRHARGACAHLVRRATPPTRRTADIAADLVDRVLPEAPYRQWVLTFPLRFLLATDPAFLASMLAAFTKTLFTWQRLRGRRPGIRNG